MSIYIIGGFFFGLTISTTIRLLREIFPLGKHFYLKGEVKEKFKNLRKILKSVEAKDHDSSRSYGRSLFGSLFWPPIGENKPHKVQEHPLALVKSPAASIEAINAKESGPLIEPETIVESEKVSVTISADFKEYCKDLTGCSSCPQELICNRGHVVANIDSYTDGNPVKILFVGDAPKMEAETSHSSPFQGSEGILLTNMIKAMGFVKGEYAVSLVIKCFTTGLQKSDQDLMIENCTKNLHLEIAFLKPDVVVALGGMATRVLLGRRERMSQVHGEFFEKELSFQDDSKHSFKIVPVFHPELLEINPNMKRSAWLDLQKIMEFCGKK